MVQSCNRHGGSEWTVAARIDTTTANFEPKTYFLKVASLACPQSDANSYQCAEFEQGRVMLEGEFHSMNELYKVAPALVPKPYAWGQLTVDNPATYYFLCDFIDKGSQDPDPEALCIKLVAMHKSSKSPTGMFGFHINPVLRGNLPLPTAWNPDWQAFFIQLLRATLSLDQRINGTWKNIGELVEMAITHVVPQVLGPLEADGRSIKPSLIHGGRSQTLDNHKCTS